MSFKKDRSGPVRRDFLRAAPALLMARQPAGARGPEIAPSGQSLAGPRDPSDVIIENEDFRLVLAADATARSLIEKRTGQECLAPAKMPVFAITQYSPLAGQLILLYPAGANTFPACTVRREGDLLVVGFEGVPHEVVLKLNVAPHYAAFTVAETRTDAKGWKGWAEQDQWKTPIEELVLLQLPVRERANFGRWLNVMWDGEVAVSVLAGNVYCRIDSQPRDGYRLLRASAEAGVRTEGVTAVLVAARTQDLLDRIGEVETGLNLPRGVESRRRKEYRYSYYWAGGINPATVDRHIQYARRGGFRMMLVSQYDFALTTGHYLWRPEYPGGIQDMRRVVRKIKDAGLIPGLHIQMTKAEKEDPYVSGGKPDRRLNLTRFFTLAAPLDKTARMIAVEEDPRGVTLEEGRRLLKIGNELIAYRNYTTAPPYQFTGCERAQLNTQAAAYDAGALFGLLDVDPFVNFVRFNQNTTIQKEVAQRIGEIYSAGFEFIYFDGSEAVHPPFWFTAGLAQSVVYQALEPPPLLVEGPHRAHLSWHMMTRGNAFDIQEPEVVKAGMRAYQEAEAPWMARDFTSIDFGWIGYQAPDARSLGTQPDMIEYVASRAAGWNCVSSVWWWAPALDAHARTADNLEAARRWEEARISGWLNESQKRELRESAREHTLLIDERGDFELVAYEQIPKAAGADRPVRAFVFERAGRTWVVYWHTDGDARLELPLPGADLRLWEELGRKELQVKVGLAPGLPLGKKRYLDCGRLSRNDVIRAFQQARVSH